METGKGYALIIGVEKLSGNYNIEGSGYLPQPPNDATAIANIALKKGFATKLLLTEDATRKNVIEHIIGLSQIAKEGDLVFIYYSGHGSQVKADEKDEEEDMLNEAWCLYDGLLIDNELYRLWRYFAAGLRIFFVSDSCHSGTMTKSYPVTPNSKTKGNYLQPKYISRLLTKETYNKNKASYKKDLEDLGQPPHLEINVPILSFAGCEDAQCSYALSNSKLSIFTEEFKRLLENPEKTYTYSEALQQLKEAVSHIVGQMQTPYLFSTGNGDSFMDQILLQIPAKHQKSP